MTIALDKIKERIRGATIKHSILILADDKQTLQKCMNKIKELNNKDYKIYNEVFNNKKNQTSLFYKNETYSGRTIHGHMTLRGVKADQIIYIGEHEIIDIQICLKELWGVMRGILNISCVPEEFQIQKWKI